MGSSVLNPTPIKQAADLVGCSDKVIRNYIKDGKISFQTVQSPYGDTYEVNPDEVSAVYNSKRSATLETKRFQTRPENYTPESPVLKDLLPTLESFRADYKEAMEHVTRMSYELGTAQKEVKLLTGDSLERSALEKQVQALQVQLAEVKIENKHLGERVEELQAEKKRLEDSNQSALETLKKENEALSQALKAEKDALSIQLESERSKHPLAKLFGR